MKKVILSTILLALVLTSCFSLSTSTQQPAGSSPAVSSATVPPTETLSPSPTPTPLPSALISAADEALFNGDYQTALELYQQAYSQAQDDQVRSAAIMGLGRTYQALADCNSAITFFNQEINQYPGSDLAANASYFLGECYDTLGNYGMAAASYASFLSLKPGIIDAEIYELEGDSLASNSDLTGAINAYTSALQSTPQGDLDRLNIKIGKAYLQLQQYENAIRTFMALYDATQSDYTKATINLLAGQAYSALGYPEQAYARYQDSVEKYPRSYDSYSQLVVLVNDNQPVNDLYRGIVDYYAGQYGYAIDALVRYINGDVNHAGSAHFYLGLCYRETNQIDEAIAAFDALIKDHPSDRFWASAWDEKSWTLWYVKQQYKESAQVMLDFVTQVPSATEAPGYLFEAGRILERGKFLLEAATTWERMINEYPTAELAYRALFLAGVTYYRLANYDYALTVFQRCLVLTSNLEDQSAANFWIGKIQGVIGDALSSKKSLQLASSLDPTGFYGIRAKEILQNQPTLPAVTPTDLQIDLSSERAYASSWVREKFNVPAATDLNSLLDLESNPGFLRAKTYYSLGMYEEANSELDQVRQQYSIDPVNSFRLLGYLISINMYRQAILTSRQILDLVYSSNEATLAAPAYFNHIRFGVYFQKLVSNASELNGINPVMLYSLIRQESMFDAYAYSSAGAIGLTQMMPATGRETADLLGWPTGFTSSDLYRPMINIMLGASYLARQRDYFGGDSFAALAAYNGGAGNVQVWMSLAQNDPDLFVECIRYDETRTYVKQIVEFYNIYLSLYTKH